MAKKVTPFEWPVYVTRPLLPDLSAVKENLQEVWDSQWLTNSGRQHELFEEKVAEVMCGPVITHPNLADSSSRIRPLVLAGKIAEARQAAEEFKRLAELFPGADFISDAKGEAHNFAEEGRLRAAKNYLAAGNFTAAKEQLDELRIDLNPFEVDLNPRKHMLGSGEMRGLAAYGLVSIGSNDYSGDEFF